MSFLKKVVRKMENDYREKIIKAVNEIENEWILDRILKFIMGITK